MKALLWKVATVVPVSLVLALACSDPTLNKYCTGIPAGGCPGLGTTNCEDHTCKAIYSDDPSTCEWTFVAACPDYVPPHDAGVDVATEDGGNDADIRARDAGFQLPDGASGGPGCPDLEAPDCPVATATLCSDCCGCQELYVCTGGGWNPWGQCSDAGTIQPFADGGQ